LGAEPGERRSGSQDRDHRHRSRPAAPVLRPDRLHDAAESLPGTRTLAPRAGWSCPGSLRARTSATTRR